MDWEIFEADREHRQAKKKRNYESSHEILDREGLSYSVQKNEWHLVVESRYDFWPSTGKFIDRVSGDKGRGIFNLIRKIKGDKNNVTKNR